MRLPRALARLASRVPPLCHARLPRSGLGNILLIWARAAVFAEQNRMPLLTTGFAAPRLGPWLRGDRDKRVYAADFRPPSPRDLAHAALLHALGHTIAEPKLAPLPPHERRGGSLFVFEALPDFFLSFAEHRDLLRERLLAMLTPARRRALDEAPAPVIGVHVRRGDFGPLAPDHDLSLALGPTPLAHFQRLIEGIREIAGARLPVTVFSDGRDDELAPLLAMPAVTRAPPRPGVIDLLVLARSRVVIPSAWSTFSMWSAFLSDAPVLLHPMKHEHLTSIRPAALNRRFYEGTVPERVADWPALLVENLRALRQLGVA
jgi:hypothetical protein